jgi:transcription elongation GreA/GreB family factor
VVAVDDGDPDRFAFGRTAEVADDAGAVHTWTLVGPTEADMSSGRLSAESPVGQALRDGRVGADIVVETPRGSRTFTIRKLV